MVLSDCEIIQATHRFLQNDCCIIPNEVCMEFMEAAYHTPYELFGDLVGCQRDGYC